MSDDANNLMEQARRQLEEHTTWLADEIRKLPSDVAMDGAKELLAQQAGQIKLRLVRADRGNVSIVWDYPDELHAFLRSSTAPKHLRDTLAGGYDVSVDQPAFTVKRES